MSELREGRNTSLPWMVLLRLTPGLNDDGDEPKVAVTKDIYDDHRTRQRLIVERVKVSVDTSCRFISIKAAMAILSAGTV